MNIKRLLNTKMPSSFLCNLIQLKFLFVNTYKYFHDPKSIDEFKCNELNCFRIFNSFHSFKSHLNQHNNLDTQYINTPLSCNLPVITTTSQRTSDSLI